jgi:hypothetical protein
MKKGAKSTKIKQFTWKDKTRVINTTIGKIISSRKRGLPKTAGSIWTPTRRIHDKGNRNRRESKQQAGWIPSLRTKRIRG